MRVALERGATLFAAVAVISIATAAVADELLVMPYGCAVVGGRPVLTPSEDQGHRIIGARETRPFAACSPVNPDVCRKWTVHRFDIDCGGARVPWTEIVAGAQRDGRVWLETGRVRLRMPPYWSLAPDDPCARLTGDDRWRDDRLARYCADRRTLSPPSFVEMPVGFAPTLGIDAVFVAATPAGPSSPQVGAGPLAAPPPAAKPARPKVVRTETPQAAPSEPRAALPEDAPPDRPSPPPKVEAEPVRPPIASPAPPPAVVSPIEPKIINRAEPPAPSAPPPTIEPPKATAPDPDVPGRRFGSPPVTTHDSKPVPVAKETPIQVSLVSLLDSPIAPIALVIAGFTTLVVAAFAFIRQRERLRLDALHSREFVAVSLDGTRAGGGLVPSARKQSAAPQASPAPTRALGEAMPRTRAEAIEVLGLGVTPDATAVAIKKIVDGLRLSWHPDHATSPSDRKLRELRLKQINVAWEILAGKTVRM
jgi:hypothetical protein